MQDFEGFTTLAVFTELNLHQAQQICQKYGLLANKITPILAGVTNSNFILETQDGTRYILTINEQLDAPQLQAILDMLEHLPPALPIAKTLFTLEQQSLVLFADKPLTISAFILGQYPPTPTANEVTQIATAMAQMHQCTYPFKRVNPRGLPWMQTSFALLETKLSADEQRLIKTQLAEFTQFDFTALPNAIIHSDLFRDNTLFLQHQLQAIIDFNYACYDIALLDVAIAINDWCFDQPQLFLQPYQQHRPLTATELSAIHLIRRYACLRFLLSRLLDWYFPSAHATIAAKDPKEMWDKLTMLPT